jgi:hypothetical protein
MYGTAFLEHDSVGPYDERYICENCYQSDFYHSEVYDVAMHDDVDDWEYEG